MEKVARHVHLIGAAGQLRTATYDSREHLVLPVIALIEGVIHAVNADTPEFVPLTSLMAAPQGWNGRPVVYGHPVRNGRQISANDPLVLEKQSFGVVFQSRMNGSRLGMEAWLDPKKAERVGAQRTLERIRAGETVEVSVGAFVVTEDKQGYHNGKAYKAIWRDIIPDHLAILEDGKIGACSCAMGCGTPRMAAAIHLVTAEGFQTFETLGGPGSGPQKGDGSGHVGSKNRDWGSGGGLGSGEYVDFGSVEQSLSGSTISEKADKLSEEANKSGSVASHAQATMAHDKAARSHHQRGDVYRADHHLKKAREHRQKTTELQKVRAAGGPGSGPQKDGDRFGLTREQKDKNYEIMHGKPKERNWNPDNTNKSPDWRSGPQGSHKNFDDKDAMRIADILVKAKDSPEKAEKLASQMARSIKDVDKALRRGNAAKDAGQHKIAKIFHDRHKELRGAEEIHNFADRVIKILNGENMEFETLGGPGSGPNPGDGKGRGKGDGEKSGGKLGKISSIGELHRLAKEDPRYEKLAMVASENLGHEAKDLDDAIKWLNTNANETDEKGVVGEINFVRDIVTDPKGEKLEKTEKASKPLSGKADKDAKSILGSGVKGNGREFTWSKRGGYADAKLKKVEEKLRAKGFVEETGSSSSSPDGSYIGNATRYSHPDGHSARIDRDYGNTKGDNRFSATIKFRGAEIRDAEIVEEQEDILSYATMDTLLEQIGESYDEISSVVEDLRAAEEYPASTPEEEESEEEIETARLESLQALCIATYHSLNAMMSMANNLLDLQTDDMRHAARRIIDCKACEGSGNKDGNPCEVCDGDGELRVAVGARHSVSDLKVIQDVHDGAVKLGADCKPQLRDMESKMPFKPFEKKTTDCDACDGTGKKDGEECDKCEGKGKVPFKLKEAEGVKMTKEAKTELIKTLVSDKHSGFTVADEKMLEAASDERLEAFRVASVARAAEIKAAAAAKSEQPKLSDDDFVKEFGVERGALKTLVAKQQAQETERKAELVAALKTAQSEYSESELAAESLERLERLAKVAKIQSASVSYEGARLVPRAAAAKDDVFANPPDPYAAGLEAMRKGSIN